MGDIADRWGGLEVGRAGDEVVDGYGDVEGGREAAVDGTGDGGDEPEIGKLV